MIFFYTYAIWYQKNMFAYHEDSLKNPFHIADQGTCVMITGHALNYRLWNTLGVTVLTPLGLKRYSWNLCLVPEMFFISSESEKMGKSRKKFEIELLSKQRRRKSAEEPLEGVVDGHSLPIVCSSTCDQEQVHPQRPVSRDRWYDSHSIE